MKPADHYKGISIITCRNGLTYTKACLKSLLEQDNQPLLILAVDNASTDGTATWLKAQQHSHPNLMRITFAEVVSVAAMWNHALHAAWYLGLDEALIVNNDTELLPETHRTLSSWDADCGMVTAVGRTAKGDLVYGPEFRPRDNPDFSCFLLKKWAWEAVGGFDENTIGGYTEDNIFHVELHRHGIRAVSIGLPFLHHLSGTLKGASKKERERIQANAGLNREYFKSRYGCLPGTKAYERLFDPATFGMSKSVTGNAQPLQVGQIPVERIPVQVMTMEPAD